MITTAIIRFNNSNIAYISVDPDTHELTGGIMDETTGIFYPIGGGIEMQLYGPYVATLSATTSIRANHGEPVDLTKIETYEGTELTYPDSDAIIVVNSASSGNLDLTGFFPPVYAEGEWSDAYINVYNHSVDPKTLTSTDRSLIFYSSVEFPVSE